MLPLVLDPTRLKAGLAGRGPGATAVPRCWPRRGLKLSFCLKKFPDKLLEGLQLLFVAGLDESRRASTGNTGPGAGRAGQCRGCSAAVRLPRPGHRAPGRVAADGFDRRAARRAWRGPCASIWRPSSGPEWTARLKEAGAARARWRAEGLSPSQVSEQVRGLIAREGLAMSAPASHRDRRQAGHHAPCLRPCRHRRHRSVCGRIWPRCRRRPRAATPMAFWNWR